jgi:hypothetical protein
MHVPKIVNFRGLFTSSIPALEDSIINIYSAISKVCLAGGKHYKMNSGTCYTIVNDLASVAKKLPRMPTIESVAIIRHKNTRISKDYTYRPYTVFTALTWLKKKQSFIRKYSVRLAERYICGMDKDITFWLCHSGV